MAKKSGAKMPFFAAMMAKKAGKGKGEDDKKGGFVPFAKSSKTASKAMAKKGKKNCM